MRRKRARDKKSQLEVSSKYCFGQFNCHQNDLFGAIRDKCKGCWKPILSLSKVRLQNFARRRILGQMLHELKGPSVISRRLWKCIEESSRTNTLMVYTIRELVKNDSHVLFREVLYHTDMKRVFKPFKKLVDFAVIHHAHKCHFEMLHFLRNKAKIEEKHYELWLNNCDEDQLFLLLTTPKLYRVSRKRLINHFNRFFSLDLWLQTSPYVKLTVLREIPKLTEWKAYMEHFMTQHQNWSAFKHPKGVRNIILDYML